MKKILLFLFLLVPFFSRAGHVGGIDLFYKYMSGNTYRVVMIIYGNCGDSEYPKLFTLNPQIDVIDSVTGGKFKTLELNLMADSVKDASPYCKQSLDSTNCKMPSGRYQGYTRFIYTDTITLPRASLKWIFRFNSSMKSGCANRLGRPSLSNYNNPSSNNAVLDATLNNTNGNNSSPASGEIMFPAYCINLPSVLNQNVTDPNNDSLVYEVVTPGYSNNCSTVNPLIGVANFNPLHTAPNTYTFDRNTGRMNFTPDVTQTSAVDIRISEYRNGVLIGTVTRERIIKVLANCGSQPAASIDTNAASATLSGATAGGEDTLITCSGNVVKFKIPVSTPGSDTIKVTVDNLFSGSNMLITKNNTSSPELDFTWNTNGVAKGVYTFYIQLLTKACPLTNTTSAKYTIIVVDPGTIEAKVTSITNCIYKAAVQYTIKDGAKPYTVSLLQNGSPIKSYSDTTGNITDSLATGTYTVRFASAGIPCTKETSFTIKDSGAYPFPPIADSPIYISYCLNFDSSKALSARGDSLATLHWYDPAGNLVTGAPVPPTDKSGTFYWTVNQQYKTCISASDTVTVHISDTACDYAPKVYNVITPNGDGKNDYWVIKNIQTYPKSVVQVYNKLGDKVFESTNYQNNWNGDDLPSGVYYYLIRINDINKTNGIDTYKGYLMIKR